MSSVAHATQSRTRKPEIVSERTPLPFKRYVASPVEILDHPQKFMRGGTQLNFILWVLRMTSSRPCDGLDRSDWTEPPLTQKRWAELLKCGLSTMELVIADARERGLVECRKTGKRLQFRFNLQKFLDAPDYWDPDAEEDDAEDEEEDEDETTGEEEPAAAQVATGNPVQVRANHPVTIRFAEPTEAVRCENTLPVPLTVSQTVRNGAAVMILSAPQMVCNALKTVWDGMRKAPDSPNALGETQAKIGADSPNALGETKAKPKPYAALKSQVEQFLGGIGRRGILERSAWARIVHILTKNGIPADFASDVFASRLKPKTRTPEKIDSGLLVQIARQNIVERWNAEKSTGTAKNPANSPENPEYLQRVANAIQRYESGDRDPELLRFLGPIPEPHCAAARRKFAGIS